VSEASSKRSERSKWVFVIIVCKHQSEANGIIMIIVLWWVKQAANGQTEAKEVIVMIFR
jgi:hypothetical protein